MTSLLLVKKILAKERIVGKPTKIPTYANSVYQIGDSYILKIYDSTLEWKNTMRMYAIIQNNSLPSPKIIAARTHPQPYIIMSFLKGHQIGEKPSLSAYRSFGEWVGRLHAITFNAFGGLQEHGVGTFYEIRKGPFRTWKEMHLLLIEHRMKGFEKTMLRPLVPKIRKHFASASYPHFRPTLIHEDLNQKNVFVSNGKVIGVIDPDGGYVGCAEEELMRIEAHFDNKPPLRKAFLEGYRKHAQLLPGYEERRPLFRLSRYLMEGRCLIKLKDYKKGKKKEAMKIAFAEINHLLESA